MLEASQIECVRGNRRLFRDLSFRLEAHQALRVRGENGSGKTSLLRIVAGLSPADLTRGGQHPKVGFLTVADLLHEWVHHDRNHIRQMLANVQAFAWPHMGNSRRFSRPTPS